MGGVFTYIVYLGYLEKILLGNIVAYTNSIFDIKNSIQGIFSGIETIVEQSFYVNNIFRFFEFPVKKRKKGIVITKIKKIEFKRVNFKYNNGEYALKDINLLLEPNNSVALVGENGSGKTTLIKLMLGLYTNYEGEIFVNEINLKEIDIESYQKKIGCIFQDYIRFEASIRENIGFGDVEKMQNDSLIWNAIERVKLTPTLSNLDGLDVMMGNWFGTKQYSIGEWQRVAIARAVVREADMYVLDEPDSAIDVVKQKEFSDIYNTLLQGKIGIIITHKIRYAHTISTKILVLRRGRIVEYGEHKQLMEKCGVYCHLYNQSEYI